MSRNHLAYSLAFDVMGVYPAAIKGGPHAYEKRTEWMEGWNAYGAAFIEKVCQINEWMGALPENILDTVEALFEAEELSMIIKEDKIKLLVNCSDVFNWASAEAEEITLEELPQLLAAIIDHPKCGAWLWCCQKRNMRPQWPIVREIIAANEWDAEWDKLPLRTDKGDHSWDTPAAQEWLATR